MRMSEWHGSGVQVLERECPPDELAKKSAKLASKRAGPFLRVPYMLAICMKRRALAHKEMPEWEETCAVAAAVQNIYLAATAAGVAGDGPRALCVPLSPSCLCGSSSSADRHPFVEQLS